MLNIMNDVRSISIIEADRIDLCLIASKINEKIKYIYTLFIPKTGVKGITLSFKNLLPLEKPIVTTNREKDLPLLQIL